MSIKEKLKNRADIFQKEMLTLYYASRNPALPLLPKILILLALAYALSPIDLIPDFIPVLGYIDDLVIIPALVSLAIKFIPEEILCESRGIAGREQVLLKKRYVYSIIYIMLSLAAVTLMITAIIFAIKLI